jgi:hypothetical protein
MAKDPWTDPDPQPGDFDAEVEAADPRDIQVVDGGGGAKVTLVVSVEGEDVERLERLAAARGQRPAEIVSALLRNS